MIVGISDWRRILFITRSLLMCGVFAQQMACANDLKPVVKSTQLSIAEPNSIKPSQLTVPVLVKNRFVNPQTGDVIGEVKDGDQYRPAIPIAGKPHHFKLGNIIVNAKEQTAVEKIIPPIRIEDGAIVRVENTGEVLWKKKTKKSLHSVRPPEYVVHDHKVFIVQGQGIAALDDRNGKVLWESPGPNDRLFAIGKVVVALDCSNLETNMDRWLIARNTSDGEVAFSVKLPNKADPEPMNEVSGFIHVRNDGSFDEEDFSYFINQDGMIKYQSDMHVRAYLVHKKNWIFITENKISKIAIDGEQLFQKTLSGFAEDAARLLQLPNGDILAYAYGPISDSGVQLARIRTMSGETVWQTYCKPAGVSHSKYWHLAYVEVRGQKLVVVSQGTYGSFIEVHDLETGRELNRWMIKEP